MNPTFQGILETSERYIFGQSLNLRLLLTALLAGGHVLLEGAPGTGKTKTVRTIAQLFGGMFRRVQFTPDLLPSDITGNTIFDLKESRFQTMKGPIFTNVLLADEINRTPPRTQAALLEAMEEKQVTIFGETHTLPDPFFVAATQNPIDFEGTYPLPEAQKDRFLFELIVDYPNENQEKNLVYQSVHGQLEERNLTPMLSVENLLAARAQMTGVVVEAPVVEYATRIVRRTRESELIRLGASPRAAIAVTRAAQGWAYLHGRGYVTPDDIKEVVVPALRHRLILVPQVELEGGTHEQIIHDILAAIPVPR
ncbi:MAG: MoxR family ATPase [Peptococcaceae bacterium]|nr:MoxR family ATPase [Peptococcaceae bacterium]